MSTVDALAGVADRLIRSCEAKKLFYELCMNMRVRIARLTLEWKTLRYSNFEEIHKDEPSSPFEDDRQRDFDAILNGMPIGETETPIGDPTLDEESRRDSA
jgi:hypothetical protein